MPPLVGNAHLLEALARDHAVGADEAQHACEHLIGRCSVVAVDDDDFRRLGLADAVIAAQAQHMLGVAVAAAVARDGLHGEERKPSFLPQLLHDLDGGDVHIAVRPAIMRLAGEDGRDVTVEGFVVEGFAPADLVAVAAEPGGELMIHDLSPWVWVGAQRCAATLAVAETGVARCKGGRAGGGSPVLHGTEERRGGRPGTPARTSASDPLHRAGAAPLDKPAQHQRQRAPGTRI